MKNNSISQPIFADIAANESSNNENEEFYNLVPLDTGIGLLLAFSSCFFIGISVIFKKLALKDIQVSNFNY